ncbi:MAG: ComF family protein [Dehalococcoidia bacterium]|nr:ComF family protein [Dehalococcoidia bacterium]
MLSSLTRLNGIALDILFPQHCLSCGKEGDLLCQPCRKILPKIAPPLCPRCGRPQPSGTLCPACVVWQTGLDGIRSPLRFDGAVRKAVHELKYNNIRALAKPMSEMLNDYLKANPIPGDVLVPVPLHQKRLRERGYNQSSLLARELGRLSGLPVIEDCLVRLRQTSQQTRTASVEERRRNVATAFACRNRNVQDRKVILIDDVSTSGSTLSACAQALKAAGAVSVWGLTFAREI